MSILYFAIAGGVVGSLLAWLGRALMDRKGVKARTACDACRRKLEWWELIPVISFLGLGGKCRSCGTGIMITDWMMELIGALLFGFAAIRFTTARDIMWFCILAVASLLLFYIDLRWMVVPRAYSVVVAFIAVLAAATSQNIFVLLLTGLLGVIFYFFLYTISSGKWVGDGDVALGFIIGVAVVTPLHLGITLLIAHVFGAAVAIILLLLKRRKFGDALPMGAFLLPAMWIVLLTYGWAK